MKKILALAALSVALMLTSPAAAQMRDVDLDFAKLVTVTAIVATKCPNVTLVDGGAIKLADRIGAQFDLVAPAVVAAIGVNLEQSYQRADLIPAVSTVVRGTLNEIIADFAKSRTKACTTYRKPLENLDLINKGS